MKSESKRGKKKIIRQSIKGHPRSQVKKTTKQKCSLECRLFLTRNGRVDRIIVSAAGMQVCAILCPMHVHRTRSMAGKKKQKAKIRVGGRLERSNMALEGPDTCELLHTSK